MNCQERENVIAWLAIQIEAPYNQIIRDEIPDFAVFLVDDNGESIAEELEKLHEDELQVLLDFDTEEFAAWVRTQFHEVVRDGWLPDIIIDTSVEYVCCNLPLDFSASEADVQTALSYLRGHVDGAELLRRLEQTRILCSDRSSR